MTDGAEPDARDPRAPAEWLTWMSRLPAEGGPTGADWVATVDRLARECLDAWDLEVTGAPMTGWTAVVHPVVRRDGTGGPLVLKVGWPHVESAQEHLALRAWDGRGAVRLVAADPSRGALLLEQARRRTGPRGRRHRRGLRGGGRALPRACTSPPRRRSGRSRHTSIRTSPRRGSARTCPDGSSRG